MTIYAGQLLRVAQDDGETSATFLTVDDPNGTMASQDAGTLYSLCGAKMSAPPALDMRQISGTLLDGTAFSYTVVHFEARGKDFYILPAALPPESVAAVTTSTPLGPVTPFDYFTHGLTSEYGVFLAGQALSVQFDSAGHAGQTATTQVAVTDDDGLIQFDGQGGGETGIAPWAMFGPGFDTALDFNTQNTAARQMVQVRVFYHGSAGDGSFVALRVGMATDTGTTAYYIPRNGGPDLSEVISYQRERPVKGSIDGLSYAAFGLNNDRQTQTGGLGDDFIQGTITHDQITGAGGADKLVGGMGHDVLDGGTGNDVLHGGAQNDTLIGSFGNDTIYGGNDADSILGGAGNDNLTGNWGHDSLFGGEGNDRLGAGADDDSVYGGAGNDSVIGFDGNDLLSDGTGVDTMNGGQDADTFVLVADGATDLIVDFQDGVDRIDLDVAFAALTITTLSAGHVRIVHSGEVLLLDDPTGKLIAADLTAADFL